MIIAIDGPSGAGKSTVSKAVAERLGFNCLDTGAMFRSVAWFAIQEGVPFDDQDRLGGIAADRRISFEHEAGNPYPVGVYIDGIEVTKEIRTAQVDRAVSAVSAVAKVRDALNAQQRAIGRSGDYVVDGRDIGTVVFPDAALKIFLTASPEVRAKRRVAQNEERGVGSTDYETVLQDINRRDHLDSSRKEAPLAAADDAITIDSSEMTIDEVISKICALAKESMA